MDAKTQLPPGKYAVMCIEGQGKDATYFFVKITDFMAPIVKEMAGQLSNGVGSAHEKEERLKLYVGSRPAPYYSIAANLRFPLYSVVDAKDANAKLPKSAKLVQKGTYGPGFVFAPLAQEPGQIPAKAGKAAGR